MAIVMTGGEGYPRGERAVLHVLNTILLRCIGLAIYSYHISRGENPPHHFSSVI